MIDPVYLRIDRLILSGSVFLGYCRSCVDRLGIVDFLCFWLRKLEKQNRVAQNTGRITFTLIAFLSLRAFSGFHICPFHDCE